MVENVTVTPGDVRGGGNIVSKGKEVKDYIGQYGVITEDTDTVENLTETVYTMKKIFIDYDDPSDSPTRIIVEDDTGIEWNPWVLGNIQLHVSVQYHGSTRWWNLANTTIYCEYDGKVISEQANSDGIAHFQINVEEGSGGEDVCRYFHLRFYYLGDKGENWENGPCFKKVTMLTCHSADRGITFFDRNPVIQLGNIHRIPILASCGGLGVPGQMIKFYEQYIEYIIQVFSNPHIIQTDVTATISARLSDEDGSAIPGKLVKFYEEYIESLIKVYSNPRVIEKNEVAQVYARVSDEDGSAISGKKVKFFEEHGDMTIVVSSDKPIIQTGETSAVSARVSDGSGVIVSEVIQFFEEYELSELNVFTTTPIIQTDVTATISARLSDEDGSAIPNTQVDFTEDYDDDYNIALNVNKEVVQTGETATATVTVKNGDTPVEDVYIRFYDNNE